MPRRSNREEFIAKARAVHGEKYGYDKVVYVKASMPVKIYCNTCKEYFEQRPDVHLSGGGCQRCAVKATHPIMSKEEFLRRAHAVHGNKYDYSQVVIKTVSDPVTIICPEHGPFSQAPINHYYAKQGCPKCGIVKCGMAIRSNTEDFIRKAREVHGDKYGYDKVVYVKGSIPVKIYCPDCKQYFKQTPRVHLAGRGCTVCAHNKPIGTEEFIRRAKTLWGEKYSYEKSVYVTGKTSIIVTCPIHGDFETNPSDFLRGHGCKHCGKESQIQKRRKSQEQFIKDCHKVHGDKYDYSQTIYRGKRNKVTIICPKHGPFEQWPDGHLVGQGCKACGLEELKKLNTKGTEKFIEDARKIHGDKYDYSEVVYVNNKTNVTVICPNHGPFEVTPQDHIQKRNGCPICQASKGETAIRVWLESHNIKFVCHKSVKSALAIGKRKKFMPDFILTDYNMFIEFNGEQHYKPKKEWGGEKQLKHQQARDAALREYCKQQGIRLLEIPYTDFDRIEEILEKELL